MTVQVPISDRVIREKDYQWLHQELQNIGDQFENEGITTLKPILFALSHKITGMVYGIDTAHDQQQYAVSRAIALLKRSSNDNDQRFHEYANKNALAILTEYWEGDHA